MSRTSDVPRTMRALVKHEAKQGIRLQEAPVPEFGHNDVLVQVDKTAICGTDVHIFNWDEWAAATIPVPMTVGHEFSGRVVAVGSEVRGLQPGDRVSAEGHVTCGHCRNCRAGKRHLCRNTVGIGVNRPGCFADYLSVPASNVFHLPDAVSDEMGAVLDPLGNAVHTALSFDLVGEDVLITGAGPIGMMAVAVARFVGARHIVITDVNDYRLDLAAKLGASHTVNVTRENLADTMAGLGMVEGFDVGLEMSGNPSAFRQLLANMNHGGSVALLGILPESTAIDWNEVVFKGLRLKGIYGREMFETWYKMASMIQSGLNIAPAITHRLDVDDYANGFDVMRSGNSGKVVLDWTKGR
ncbi:L-threonine 3-dehydrogenase [Paucidesulfovibrio gracilis DSM 16080]|uniref:L-threonine 3-dehydrogenase n=2 Tax=Paucidesulfovibrio TaxID=2910985 RepID=A0A1T4W5L2_9BACT|nr:L-threonine 3-dehydrogenase [Paucidesulfovibrio gracilis]SKA71991.1 L-threonine 3-dehydrogenase [Paucidesulfovibrio gracilis DSM 16080]